MPNSVDVEAQAPRHHSDDTKDPDANPGNTSPPAPKYGDTSATYWKLYASEAKTSDNNLVDSLKGKTNSMVILSTLFSSIVASFIIEIYKTLLPGNSQQTPHSVRINIVLLLSFFLSITSAVSCVLIQQWCDEYLNFAYPRAAPHERGRVRTYRFQGLDQFQMRRFMYGIYVLLHLSVFLFFLAISDFFCTVNHLFGIASLCALVVSSTIYMLLSISPLIFSSSPYNTPMTPPLRAGYFILLIIIRWCLRRFRNHGFDLNGLRYYRGIHFNRALLYSTKAEERADRLESYAMKWLFTENDFSDNDMDKFLEGLPGYVSSRHTKKGQLDQYLTADPILTRIKEHFITCATSVELCDKASIDRVSFSVEALRFIFQYSLDSREDPFVPDKLVDKLRSQQNYIQRLMDDFQTLCGMDDPTIALRASCVRALAVQGLLSPLVPQNSKATGSPPIQGPLIAIYKFFFSNDDTDVIRLGDGHAPEVKKMWKNLMYDGPLANLTMLAQDVLKREDAPPSTLSFCWKTLDILLTQHGTFHSKEFTPAQGVFDDLHEKTRIHVHEKRGSHVAPLLDILDTVSRGRRLLMVFSGHPKYQNRADVVFGKDDLRNGDLLEAFAHCLPDFISKNDNSPEVCRGFLEEVVRRDGLWTGLQVNLWNTQRSDSPTPDKLRIFEGCCAVLDLAFSVLEDSKEVDWRAPEFGSLLQHFESFIAHCFQGAFMGRATSFRVGVIKARFCKALLSQFQRDLDREGTVSFRSQWDIASLARLICTLDLRDKEDPEFWNSYVDGGYIGAEFMAKAVEMIEITARDGPLLIFCVLGHLAASAVPLDQSGLERKDIEKVWELQSKVIDKTRVPLDRTSDAVREKLVHLRKQVNDLLLGKNSGEDKEILEDLLRMIDDVFSGSEGLSQSEPAEERGTKTLVTVNPTFFLREPRGISDRPTSPASESTVVSGGPSSGTQAGDGEDRFEQRSADKYLDRERNPYVRSESPRSYGSGSHSPSSPLLTSQGDPSVEIVNQSISSSPSAIHFPSIGDARRRPAEKRTGSGYNPTKQSPVTRTSTGALLTSRGYGILDLSYEGQSGAAPLSSPPSSP